MKLFSFRLTLLFTFLLFPVWNCTTPAADKPNGNKFKPIPLDWDWKASEITALKDMLKDVKTKEDGSFEYEGPTWIIRTFHTPRFTVQVSQYMEMFSDIFSVAFQFQKESELKDIKPILTVYPNESAYQRVVELRGSAGVFYVPPYKISPSKQLIDFKLMLATYYVSVEKEPSFDKKAPLGIIQHEATHCLLQKVFGPKKIPDWLTEGAATYYESWDIRKKVSDDDAATSNVKIRNDRRTHSWRPQAMQYLTKKKNGELPRLDYVTSLDTYDKWNCDNMGEQTSYHYCLAESFMDYLMNSKNRRPFLYAIMQRLHDGVTPIVTPEEQLEHERAWLMFLEEKWGVKFDKNRIQQRVEELKKRVDENKNGNGKSGDSKSGKDK